MNTERIIFLDTSIFESENYFEGKKINILFILSKEGSVHLKITDIVYREIINRLISHTTKGVNILKKQTALLRDEGRILRNLESLESYFKIIDYRKVKTESILEIKKKFEKILSAYKIEIIDTSNANVKEVLNDYFKTSPPFKEGSKKNEFPDALSINSIKNWCLKNTENCLHISNDKDFENYSDENIDCNYNLSTLLDLLNKENEENNDILIEFINDKYEDSILDVKCSIESYLMSHLESSAYNKIENDPWFEDVSIDFEEIEETEINLALLNEIDKTDFTYELDTEIVFTVNADYTDLNDAYYDREDNLWFSEERKSGLKRFRANVLIYPNYQYNIENKTSEFIEIIDFEIRSIDEL